MNTNETLILTVAVVVVVALFLYKERLLRLIIKTRAGTLDLRNAPPGRKSSNDPPREIPRKIVSDDNHKPIVSPAVPAGPSHLFAWLYVRLLKISVSLVLILLLIVMPFWWWNRHPEFWKLELSHHISEAWMLWNQGPKEPLHVVQSGHTLQGLTRLFDGYANTLGHDPHRATEVWVVDHYWQYWATDTFNDYMRANRRFVDSGGKIHRMFILTPDDLRNPQVTAVLRSQCEKIGADVWRGDAVDIGNKAEYQITAKAFQQLPYTETGFQSFDVLQLEDLTYYSSDFSPDYRVVGASTWFFGQKLDLKPLFNKSIAQRIDCSAWRTQVVQDTQRH